MNKQLGKIDVGEKASPFQSKEAPTQKYLGSDQGLPIQLMSGKTDVPLCRELFRFDKEGTC